MSGCLTSSRFGNSQFDVIIVNKQRNVKWTYRKEKTVILYTPPCLITWIRKTCIWWIMNWGKSYHSIIQEKLEKKSIYNPLAWQLFKVKIENRNGEAEKVLHVTI